MSLPRFSVHRPIFVTMVTCIVVLLGGVSLSHLPIDLLPEVALPTLSISTDYENASPEEMERLVTEVIEQTVSAVPGVEEITSSSSEGVSTVRLSFVWGTDLDAASNDVRDRLDRVVDELPEEASRPQLRQFDVANFPIVILGVSSALDPVELTQLIEDQIQYRLERIPGVAVVDVWGGFTREVQVRLDPQRLVALGLPLDDILDAIRQANIDLPAGQIEQGRFEVTLRTPGQFTDLDQLRRTVVALRDGAPVLLGQVATIRDTHAKITRIIRTNGERGVRMAVRKQSGANTVEVARRVTAEIEAINADLPQVRVVAVINQAQYIERSIANVARSVIYGGFLAIFVLLFFLRNIRSTLVIAVAIPISVIATFALVYFGGFTLNLMTLGGLALGVGMMVDNSIVVLENIFRHRDEGREAAEPAAVAGAGEVAAAIIASTITTLVIFLPLIFIEGVSGVLFRQLAYVIAFSLIASLAVALSLVPMLASRLLGRPMHQESGGQARRPKPLARLTAAADFAFDRLDTGYRDLLRRVLRHRLATVGIALGLLALSLLLAPLIGTEFMPPSDEGEVRVTGEMEVGTRLAIVDRHTQAIERVIVDAVPEIENMTVSIGPSGYRASASAEGEIRLALIPARQRQRSNIDIADDLRQRLDGRIPGMVVRTRAPQGQMLLNRLIGGDESLGIEIRGFDLATLDLLAVRVAEAIADVPGITDVRTSREAGVPQQLLRIDRDKAADMGLSVRQIAAALETAVAGSRAGEFRQGGNAHRILVQLEDAEQRSLDEILDLTLRAGDDDQVALRNVVTPDPARGPVLIDRKDQQRLVTVTANTTGRDLGSIAADVRRRLDAIPRPVGYEFIIAGDYQEQQEAFHELVISFSLALLLVYMVLACQYESLRDPLVVMFSVPLAAIGVLLMLFLTGTTLNVQSYIGCIMLGGIVVNNAILLVDQAGRLRRDGMTVADAVAEAGRRRLRPILMTSLTTMLGLLPLALGIGEGADAQAPLARAVMGGLTTSTLITLMLIPAVYSLMHPERRVAA